MKKFFPLEHLALWRLWAGPVAATNGVFDFLHAGHVECLRAAAKFGSLIVGVNDDAGAAILKGPGRPVQTAEWRASVLAELECVSAVTIFPGVSAAAFLKVCQPDVWVKGGDRRLDQLAPDEVETVTKNGGKIELIEVSRRVHSSDMFRVTKVLGAPGWKDYAKL